MNSIGETVRCAARELAPHSDSPRLDAELLLGEVLGLSRPALMARDTDAIAAECRSAYARLIARRVRGTPVAYLTGRREFWSLTLRVTPAVLVPRPETEILVEQALRLGSRGACCDLLDLGTGSGAVALAVASERSHWRVSGVDLSPSALEVAVANSHTLGLTRIEWLLGCWFEPVAGRRFDVITANPPYVAAADTALAMLSAEPHVALCPGPTGLEAIRAIVAQAPPHLNAGGWLILEHGAGQAAEAAALLEDRGFSQIRTHDDFSGKPRVTLGTHL